MTRRADTRDRRVRRLELTSSAPDLMLGAAEAERDNPDPARVSDN